MEAILWYMKEITANIQVLKTSIKEKVLFDMEKIVNDAKQD